MSSVWSSVVGVLEAADLREQRLLRGVEVLHEVDEAAPVLVGDLLLLLRALVVEDDLQAPVEEGHRLQPLEHGAGDELGALGDEHRRVRPERDRGAALAAARRRRADDLHLALRLAALGVLLAVALAVAVDLEQQALGQRVDDADADAVEAARDLVAAAAELAAGVQHGQHDLGRALALVRAGRVGVDRDAAAVVVDAAAAVGEQRDDDARAVAGHRLVDGVVDDLPDEVVEAGEPGRADVHAGALADRVEALQDLDVLGPVVASRTGSSGGVVSRHGGFVPSSSRACVPFGHGLRRRRLPGVLRRNRHGSRQGSRGPVGTGQRWVSVYQRGVAAGWKGVTRDRSRA